MDEAECKKNFQKRIQQIISANEELRHKILRKSVPLIVGNRSQGQVILSGFHFSEGRD